jgi:hypothetical protein
VDFRLTCDSQTDSSWDALLVPPPANPARERESVEPDKRIPDIRLIGREHVLDAVKR